MRKLVCDFCLGDITEKNKIPKGVVEKSTGGTRPVIIKVYSGEVTHESIELDMCKSCFSIMRIA